MVSPTSHQIRPLRRVEYDRLVSLVNLVDRVVEVHRQPHAAHYQQISLHVKGERLRLLAFPDVELNVDDFLR